MAGCDGKIVVGTSGMLQHFREIKCVNGKLQADDYSTFAVFPVTLEIHPVKAMGILDQSTL